MALSHKQPKNKGGGLATPSTNKATKNTTWSKIVSNNRKSLADKIVPENKTFFCKTIPTSSLNVYKS